jgi:hypothetical protein
MPDEQQTTTTTNGGQAAAGAGTAGTATTAPPAGNEQPGTPPAGGQKLLSQEEVNRLVGQARQEGRNSALREKTAAPKGGNEGGDGAAPAPTVETLRDELDQIKKRSVFDKHVAKAGLSDEQAEMVFPKFLAESPQDPAAWATKAATTFGIKTQATTTTTDNTAGQTTAAATVKPVTAQTAPRGVNALESGGLIDIFSLSDDDRIRLGPDGLRREFEKILAEGNARSGAPGLPKALRAKG